MNALLPAEGGDRLRVAIAGAAALSFVAGLAVGAFLAGRDRPAVGEGPFPDYERRFREAFDPTREQVAYLRHLLRNARSQEDAIRNRFADRVEPQLRDLGARVETALHEDVLSPEQRRRYDELLLAGEAGRP